MPNVRKWVPGVFVAIAFALSAAAWPRLPESMPLHWDMYGHVNGWGSRAQGALLLPLVSLVMWIVLSALPRIDPRRANYAKFQDSYDLVVAAGVGCMVLLHAAILAAALGHHVPMDRLAPVVVGGLFLVLGNVLPRARPNFWFGVRTPWTLSNDRVWERTHRVSGRLMVAAGVVTILSAGVNAPWNLALLLTASLGAAFGSIGYSYFAWRQEQSR